MTKIEELEYAMARKGLALLMGDAGEVAKWTLQMEGRDDRS